MKHLTTVFILVIRFIFPGLSDEPVKAAQPRLVVGQTVISVGRIPVEVPSLTHSFTLKNEGDAPLEITSFQRFGKDIYFQLNTKTINPGGSITLVLILDTTDIRGYFWEGVRLFTNDPKTNRATFAFEGHIFTKIDLSEDKIELPNIALSAIPVFHHTLTVEINHQQIQGILTAKTANGLFKTTVSKESAKTYTVDLEFTHPLPEGPFQDELDLTFGPDGAVKRQIPITGFLRCRIEPSNRFISLKEFQLYTPPEISVWLTLEEPFAITSIEAPKYLQVTHHPIQGQRGSKLIYCQKLIIKPQTELPLSAAKDVIKVFTDRLDAPMVVLIVVDDRKAKSQPGPAASSSEPVIQQPELKNRGNGSP